jgi:hypothetical protein
MALCNCESGEQREAVYDAKGIFVAYVCHKCRKQKLKGYRPEIFTDSGYECDELVDPEPGVFQDDFC